MPDENGNVGNQLVAYTFDVDEVLKGDVPTPQAQLFSHYHSPVCGFAVTPGQAVGLILRRRADGTLQGNQCDQYEPEVLRRAAGPETPPGPWVDLAARPEGGFLIASPDGRVLLERLATPVATLPRTPEQPRVVAVASRPSDGFWLAAADGGVFTFDGAPFLGSMGGRRLAAPVVDLLPTPSGGGYWLVAADGGVFAFGDAGFFGSMGGRRLAAPVVGGTATASGAGYLLTAADGGVFTFGDAAFAGSAANRPLQAPVVATIRPADGPGYYLAAADGGVFTFGGAPFLGAGVRRRPPPFTGMATVGPGAYVLLTAAGEALEMPSP